jgi:hypothetical protein
MTVVSCMRDIHYPTLFIHLAEASLMRHNVKPFQDHRHESKATRLCLARMDANHGECA